MAGGKIEANPLFLGLTRPSMVLGVTYVYAALEALSSVMAFIITSNFIYLLVMLPCLHCIAYFICLKEPLMLELILMKTSNFSVCPNKTFHGGVNSYDVY
ncbi:MAG: VirB3 family type IV secretion system protein [Rickettsiales bacterium]|jgi:type IV secretion system protein VirB3|nr:VirB3 family type IV secretion system protein [Rickettsiales bacterium]